MERREPNQVARLLLAVVVCSAVFGDYWEYSRQYHLNSDTWMDVIRGTANAPQQYRIGVPWLANTIAHHAHLGLRHGFTLLDLAAGLIAAFLLYGLFERSEVYRRASIAGRWMGAATFLFLLHLYLSWITWYQRPETLPSACMLAGTLVLASGGAGRLGRRAKALRIAGMLVLTAAQGFIRADVAFSVHLGFLLLGLTRFGDGFALGRRIQAITSAAAVLLAGGIQYYLMHVVYPHATYGATPVLEIRQNLTNPLGMTAILLFMIPWMWLLWLAAKGRAVVDPAGMGVLVGSAMFFVMWLTVARLEEVRIFLPYAVALIPFTANCAIARFAMAEPTPVGTARDRVRRV